MSTGSVAFVGLANSACSSFLTALGLVLQQAARNADAAAFAKRGAYTATRLQVGPLNLSTNPHQRPRASRTVFVFYFSLLFFL